MISNHSIKGIYVSASVYFIPCFLRDLLLVPAMAVRLVKKPTEKRVKIFSFSECIQYTMIFKGNILLLVPAMAARLVKYPQRNEKSCFVHRVHTLFYDF